MHFDLSIPAHLSAALGPDLLLMVGSMLLALWAAWRDESPAHQRSVGWASVALVVATMAAVGYYWWRGTTTTAGVVTADGFRWAADLVLLLGTLLTLLLSIEYNDRAGITAGESHVLVLFATSGMMLLAAARDLMIVFLGIELMSIAVYVLAGLNRRSGRSAEGALKYFLLGSFSTGFLLYGIALVYGATATTNFATIGDRVAEFGLHQNPILLVGIALLVIGYAFKVAAAPFHMWAPDVYEGSPTPITAYMAAVVKGAAFVSLLRLFIEAFPELLVTWHRPVWWLAVVTMVVGNVVALAQRNVKRMLAYSSIAHAGYLLVTLAVVGLFPEQQRTGAALGSSALVFYLLAYTLATFGAFGVIAAVGGEGESNPDMDAFAGLWDARPGLAVAMAVFMLALLGFPLFGGIGFLAKLYLLQAALDAPAPQTRLAVAVVLTSVLSAGYYLRLVMVMFMRARETTARPLIRTGGVTRLVVGATAVLIILLGVAPNLLLRPMTDLHAGRPARDPGLAQSAVPMPVVGP